MCFSSLCRIVIYASKFIVFSFSKFKSQKTFTDHCKESCLDLLAWQSHLITSQLITFPFLAQSGESISQSLFMKIIHSCNMEPATRQKCASFGFHVLVLVVIEQRFLNTPIAELLHSCFLLQFWAVLIASSKWHLYPPDVEWWLLSLNSDGHCMVYQPVWHSLLKRL